VSVGKERIFSASTSAFYHFEDPHISIFPVANPYAVTSSSSHHMEKTEAGLKGIYIGEITLK